MTHGNTTALVALIGALIPILTGFVAKEKSPGAKAVLNGLLSALAGGVATEVASPDISLVSFLLSMAITWASSIAAYHGFWGPTGIVDRFVEWAVKPLAKIGIHLPKQGEEDIVSFLQAVFGDAIQFLSEEEMRMHLFKPAGSDTPVRVGDHTTQAHAIGGCKACNDERKAP